MDLKTIFGAASIFIVGFLGFIALLMEIVEHLDSQFHFGIAISIALVFVFGGLWAVFLISSIRKFFEL